MEIIVQRAGKIQFRPDLQQWNQQNPPSQFCITNVGGTICFVKRQKRLFSGWGLLVKAISEQQIRHTPRVIAIAKHDEYYYFFTEKIDGKTLEEVLKKRSSLKKSLVELINQLFITIYNINQLGFWYSDLCRKNIFVATTGEYYLIDIDSCVSHQEPFDYMKVAFEYPPLLIEFARTTGKRPNFQIKGHSGECINQAELVAIAMDIKKSFNIPMDKKAPVLNTLLWRNIGREYVDLFTDLMNGHSNWIKTRQVINRIKDTP